MSLPRCFRAQLLSPCWLPGRRLGWCPGSACFCSKELEPRPGILELGGEGGEGDGCSDGLDHRLLREEDTVLCALSTDSFRQIELCCFSLLVKCLKNTPAFFAERLNKAMRVRNFHMQSLGGRCLSPPCDWDQGLRAGGMGRATPQQRGRGPTGRRGPECLGMVGW